MTLVSYPARLDGQLDQAVGRWLWLVKWLLLIPHFIVLFFLWLAFSVLTMVAGFAVLFTGRYPRAIFDFNVGVIRWSWRVSFYGICAFGTDRYPPFSLSSDPNYPADFSVEYPERLSRGLVLVKWWLPAIPQYLIVAIFAAGWMRSLGRPGRLFALRASRVGPSGVQAERRVLIAHERRGGKDSVAPPVEPHHKIEELPRVAARDRQRHGTNDHEEGYESSASGDLPRRVLSAERL
jgi:hypothetical protein